MNLVSPSGKPTEIILFSKIKPFHYICSVTYTVKKHFLVRGHHNLMSFIKKPIHIISLFKRREEILIQCCDLSLAIWKYEKEAPTDSNPIIADESCANQINLAIEAAQKSNYKICSRRMCAASQIKRKHVHLNLYDADDRAACALA
jgi:hypothetical protein